MNSVVFDQLRITEDGSTFFIDVHIDSSEYYENLYLDTITLITGDYVLTTDPSSPASDFIYKNTIDGNQKELSIILTKADIDAAFVNTDSEGKPIDPEKPYASIPFNHTTFSKDLFFVYIGCKGYVRPDAPCGDDNMTSVGIIYDETMYHQLVMNYTRELARDCQIPDGFIDLILLQRGFESAVETDHYLPAVEFWNKMFKDGSKGILSTAKGCGCHG